MSGMSASTTKAGGAMGVLGKAANYVLGGVLAVGAASIKAGMDAQSLQAQLAGTEHIGMRAARNIADHFANMGSTVEYSSNALMTAFAPVSAQLALIQGHALDAAQSMQVMTQAAELSAAQNQDSTGALQENAQALATTMQIFHETAGQASEIANQLFNIGRATNQPISLLSTVLGRLHSRLGEAMPSLSDIGTMMLELASKGAIGSRGTMILSTAMNTLMGQSKKVHETLNALNMRAIDPITGKFIGMRPLIQQLHDRFKGLTGATQDQIAQTLFGTSAWQLMLQVIQGGVPTLDKYAAAVKKVGTLHVAAVLHSKTLAGQLADLKKTVENLARSLGLALVPALTNILKAIEPVIDKFAKWAAQHPKELAHILELTAAVAGFVKILEGLAKLKAIKVGLLGAGASSATGIAVSVLGWAGMAALLSTLLVDGIAKVMGKKAPSLKQGFQWAFDVGPQAGATGANAPFGSIGWLEYNFKSLFGMSTSNVKSLPSSSTNLGLMGGSQVPGFGSTITWQQVSTQLHSMGVTAKTVATVENDVINKHMTLRKALVAVGLSGFDVQKTLTALDQQSAKLRNELKTLATNTDNGSKKLVQFSGKGVAGTFNPLTMLAKNTKTASDEANLAAQNLRKVSQVRVNPGGVTVSMTLSGGVYVGNLHQLANELGKLLATTILPGAGVKINLKGK